MKKIRAYAIIEEGLKTFDYEKNIPYVFKTTDPSELAEELKRIGATDETHTVEEYFIDEDGEFYDGSDFDRPSNFFKRTSAQRRAADKYDAKNMKKMTFKFHLRNDKDILDKLAEVPNKAEYLRNLIRADIKSNC